MRTKSYDIEYLYDGDRWKVLGSKEVYRVSIYSSNGITYGKLNYFAHPKHAGTYLFGGLPNIFAPLFKEFLRSKGDTLKKVRRRKKDRIGERITLWW